MYGSCCSYCGKEETNGSKAVNLLLRLSTLALALSSAVFMATAGECTIVGLQGVNVTISYKHYPPFMYLVASNIVAAILEAVAIYLQFSKVGDDEEWPGKLPGILQAVVDVVVLALLTSSTGATYAAVYAYGGHIETCGRFCQQVDRSKVFSLAASAAVILAAVAKDVPLPFSVWPRTSE